ncbi:MULTISPECIES: DNA-directed RNA polymerase subunit omega [Convivina]|uniref:DNA-directed RNA polymerase subunit omega n=2 Tax=Convivina TaxID=1697027 RepID=A0A2U1DBR4_9LACO|nr:MULTISPECIES: DNA-directed RNA polymerase subunit omega [Convivina]SDB88299.1 DNA-directed RNA polymerase subunit omega [Leuconostocaceae bacterium R-53105]PVY85124.1 DNA-directed RNA polymerase subunit omega [Convivina intestini]CAH1852741.1 DNA-directed RNA polymerase subunit omega [Convivina sp. LMG 32447]CAH1852771.1 DNA-directed RNA polymerase subunit omega [Convivina sp. LMG 32447]CAH1853857.1 DNA-directed RNA polymerase subunit omega [Convivina intestini]
MLLYPSVDKLLERVDSRYKLIALASKRARQLDAGLPATQVKFTSRKSVGEALEEIEAGDVVIDPVVQSEQV